MTTEKRVLSQEEIDLIPQFRDKYLKMALDTSKLDETKAEKAVLQLYKVTKLPPPKVVLFTQSPLHALYMRGLSHSLTSFDTIKSFDNIIQKFKSKYAKSDGSFRVSKIKDKIADLQAKRDELISDFPFGVLSDDTAEKLYRDFLRTNILLDLKEDRKLEEVSKEVANEFLQYAMLQMETEIINHAVKHINKLKRDNDLWRPIQFIGSFENYWIAWGRFLEKIGIAFEDGQKEQFEAYAEYAESCGCAFLFDDLAIVCDRPVKIKFDDEERLHAEEGQAIEFPDGYGVTSWHGVRVPYDWLNGKPPTAAAALAEENLELRRCACEILGWDKILRELNSVVIDVDGDPEIGELLEVEIPDIGKEKFLRVQCGTGRTFAIPVPPDMKTALEANAWTWNLDSKEYMPEIRT